MLALYRIVRHVMPADILKVIDAVEGRVPAVLRALKTAHRYRDQDIGAAMGMTRSAVQARMTGTTQCSPGELAGFAVLFDVPVGLFYDPPEWVTPPAKPLVNSYSFGYQSRRSQGYSVLQGWREPADTAA